jgi:hypothetical protein
MRSTAIIAATASLVLVLAPPTPAHADGTALPGTRPLGTGGAMRAAATGDAGPMLNPSGISLLRAYSAESFYRYGTRDSTQDAHVSVVDSTSGINLGGALYYTYHHASPDAGTETGHLAGVSLSFPLADVLLLGATAKYMHFSSATDPKNGFTFDAGTTIRAGQFLSLAVVGYNLTNPKTSFAPLAIGGGASVSPVPGLLLLIDGVIERVSADPNRDNAYSLMGGGEYMASSLSIRLGGGHDGLNRNGYLSGGLSAVSTVGALDASVRRDISGDRKGTFVGVSARLFVPNN